MNDQEIETQRVAGDIWLTLHNGTPEEKASLLRVIEKLSSPEVRESIEVKLLHDPD